MTRARSRLVRMTSITILALVIGGSGYTSAATTVGSENNTAVPYDRDGDGKMGEETAIKQRLRAYVEHHGVDGVLTSERMLARARWGYESWLEQERRRQAKGIDGNGWISLGPNNGAGRSTSVVPHPTDVGTLLTGAAGGGLWRSTDDGLTWIPLTEGISDLSVGAVAYARQNPEVIYLGTGEGGYAGDFIPGIGLLRSDDGGHTWMLPNSAEDMLASQFFALDVYHPQGSDVSDPATYTVLAATNEGLFRSVDGGATWETLISRGSLAGVSEILRPDPNSNPDLLYTALWCSGTCPAGLGRVMKSTDGGDSWLPATEGLPATSPSNYGVNRNALTATADGQTLFLGLNTGQTSPGGDPVAKIFRSDNGGELWVEAGKPGPYLGSQGWYDNTITVHPTDPDKVIAGGVYYVVSGNGGESWRTKNPYQGGGANLPHVDAHDLQWQGDTLWVACDGGIWKSTDWGNTWQDRNETLVTRQFYGMALDPINRERLLGGTQDNSTNLRREDDGDAWDVVIGGDGFECAINSVISDFMYGSVYYTQIYRSTSGGTSWTDISPRVGNDSAPFITPLTMRYEAPWVLYTGSTRVWETTDAGQTWRNLPTTVEAGSWTTGIVRAIAVTPADPEMLVVSKGSVIYITTNGGESWRQSSVGRTALNVEISPFDPNELVAAMAGSTSGVEAVMRSSDSGATWSPAGTGLPPFSVQVVRWDPTDSAVLYAGTDVGLYRSTDGGYTWAAYGDGLPAASVHDLRVMPDGTMLKVATHGRGMWELEIDRGANLQPTIDITSHANSLSAYPGDTVTVAASASDPDGDPLKVTWFIADEWQQVDGGSGIGMLDSTVPLTLEASGKYQIVAHAVDNDGWAAYDQITAIVFEPANLCATPEVIPATGPFPTDFVGSNVFARRETSDPDVSCIDNPDEPTAGSNASVWFEFTPVETNTYGISTCGSESDTVLSVWTGDACGPYTEVTGSCNDDDEIVHCSGQRTDSYVALDLEAGITYRILVGAYSNQSKGKFRLQVDCENCSSAIPGRRYIVPAAANAAGENGTSWVTDLNLFNRSAEAAAVEIAFLPAGSDNSAVTGEAVTVEAGSSREFVNVVGELLGASGSGALRILSSTELVIASRTYNDAEAGTFGQYIPGAAGETAVAPGASVRLIGLSGNAALRTNIGIANTADASAAVTFELVASDGQTLASRAETVAPQGWLQINKIFEKEDLADVEAVTAVIHNTSSEATVMVYASVVDALTGDPTYVTATSEATPGTPLWIAAAAHADGSGTSVWRTDLEIANTSNADLVATIELMLKGVDNSTPASTTFQLAAGHSARVGDVLAGAFDVSGSAALRISSNAGSMLVTSRTYNLTDMGTFGQFIPGVTEAAAVVSGESGIITQLRHDDTAFRTNLGLVNLGAESIDVEALYYEGSGEYLGFKSYSLEPFEYFQDNGALPGDSSTDNGFVVLRSTTDGAGFLAYASVIDRGSDDPVFIPASVIAD